MTDSRARIDPSADARAPARGMGRLPVWVIRLGVIFAAAVAGFILGLGVGVLLAELFPSPPGQGLGNGLAFIIFGPLWGILAGLCVGVVSAFRFVKRTVNGKEDRYIKGEGLGRAIQVLGLLALAGPVAILGNNSPTLLLLGLLVFACGQYVARGRGTAARWASVLTALVALACATAVIFIGTGPDAETGLILLTLAAAATWAGTILILMRGEENCVKPVTAVLHVAEIAGGRAP